MKTGQREFQYSRSFFIDVSGEYDGRYEENTDSIMGGSTASGME
jgi:hypothetical protein